MFKGKTIRWAVPAALAVLVAATSALLAANKPAKKSEGPMIAPKEALRRGALALWAAESAKAKVAKYLAEAQSKKDIVRINCVQEKLSRLNTVVELARQTLQRLRQEAPRDSAGDTSRLLYEKMVLLREQAEGLRRDAESCSGEELSYTGATKVTVERDKNIPDQDVTDPPEGFRPIENGFGRPPEVSPYL